MALASDDVAAAAIAAGDQFIWILDLLQNCIAYSLALVPGYLFVRYYKRLRPNYDHCAKLSGFHRWASMFVFGFENPSLDTPKTSKDNDYIKRLRSSKLGEIGLHIFCFTGLCLYLIWGILQEKMMTKLYYQSGSTIGERFTDSQFIVFLNRILAFLFSYIYIRFCDRRQYSQPPLYKYSFASLSNILSSWCQYEALKFVSFPTQVVGKASKIVPTMIVGRFLEHRSYPWHQYLTGALISAGVSLFIIYGPTTGKALSTTTTYSGVVLIGGYIIFDSFTSNYQGLLFSQYHLTSVQVMCGVNFFSMIFLMIPMLLRSGVWTSISFMLRHTDFFIDSVATSFCSAAGQFFIFLTISQFGAVTFTIMVTIRQALSILLSCLIYGHHIDIEGIAGLVLIFVVLLLKPYLNRVFSSSATNKR